MRRDEEDEEEQEAGRYDGDEAYFSGGQSHTDDNDEQRQMTMIMKLGFVFSVSSHIISINKPLE